VPYNQSLAFYSNQGVADPKRFFSGELGQRMEVNATSPLFKKLPDKLRKAIPGNPDMVPRLTDFFSSLNDRKSWVFAPPTGSTAPLASKIDCFEVLKEKGLYFPDINGKNILALNGWVHFVGSQYELKISHPITLAGHGGIILEKGNIFISAEIDGGEGTDPVENPEFSLHLVALEGNIVLGLSKRKVDATLVAKEKILITKERPTIRGAVAMGKFDIRNASYGANIEYNQNLAKILSPEPKYGGEKELLGFSVDPVPISLK